MAQLALAQFYSANKTNPSDVLHTYAWYSIASERMSQAWKDATKAMTIDQVLEAEQMAARWLNSREKTSSIRSNGTAPRRRSTAGEDLSKGLLDKPRRSEKASTSTTKVLIGRCLQTELKAEINRTRRAKIQCEKQPRPSRRTDERGFPRTKS